MTTMDIAVVRDLLARVEMASGPDREMDFALHRLDMGAWLDAHGYRREGDGYVSDDFEPRHCCGPEPFTASIDAAVALIERVLPDGWWRVEDDAGCDRTAAGAWIGIHRSAEPLIANAPSPALALCAALLKATIAKAELEPAHVDA